MLREKFFGLGFALIIAGMLTACGQETQLENTGAAASEVTEVTQAPTVQQDTVPSSPNIDFEDLESLLGLSNQEAADRFGVSAENWTEDKASFIGRIYQVTLFGQPVKVFTSYGSDDMVASVSAWVTDGTQEVAEEEVQTWAQRIGEYTHNKPIVDSASSEGGSRSWKWRKDDIFISLRWLENLVSIEMLPAVGELK